MKTNNVSVSIDIRDGDKVYKADWTFTELALKEYKDAGLSRQRQITSLMMKMLQSELAIHLINDEEALAENDIISTYLDPTYSFETYTLDPEQQLTYQKILVDNMGFRAG